MRGEQEEKQVQEGETGRGGRNRYRREKQVQEEETERET